MKGRMRQAKMKKCLILFKASVCMCDKYYIYTIANTVSLDNFIACALPHGATPCEALAAEKVVVSVPQLLQLVPKVCLLDLKQPQSSSALLEPH